ncbi:MAG TPA: HWE histidine kinase domain-containing protein [Xanthobacteraceae bacterium]|nr:HWE histidine kinase domain-containing protein [Xanthobacteraceae bacterium]
MGPNEPSLTRIAELERENAELRERLRNQISAATAAAQATSEVATQLRSEMLTQSFRADVADNRSRTLAMSNANLAKNNAFINGILESSDDCIKVISLDGELLFMSGGGQRVMEVNDFEVIRGCQWPTFWPGDGTGKAQQAIEAARSGKSFRFDGPAPTAKGTMKHWEVMVSPIFNEDGAVESILSISRDVSYRYAMQEQQKTLARELHHRVNNTLAVVSAIISQTMRTSATMVDANTAMAGRIRALGRANTLLVNDVVALTTVEDTVCAAIEAFDEQKSRIVVSGPEVTMSSRPSVFLALAINELSTNATKYGALSTLNGNVSISWTADNGVFDLVWRETGGPLVTVPTRKSFGTTLINSTLTGPFGGIVKIDYAESGVICTIEAPLASLVEAQ